MPSLARQHHQNAILVGAHEGFHAPIREIGDGQHIHHAPGVVRRIAVQRPADGAAYVRACAVAADDVVGAQLLGLALAARGGVFHRDGDGVLGGAGVDDQVHHLQTVVGFQPRGRVPHEVEEHVVYPRLVDQHMGHLGGAVGHVLHTRDTREVFIRAGRPECGFIDPDRLAHHLSRKAEGLEHLHRAHADAVGLAFFHRPQLGFDQHGADPRYSGELGGQTQPCRPGAGNQHVHRFRQRVARAAVAWGRREDIGVSGIEAVDVELHGVSFIGLPSQE